jgi:sulfide:quinone oxidoreductase
MRTRVVVLGAGFGGLELTTALSDDLGETIDIVLVDKGDVRAADGCRGSSSLP